MADTLPCPVCGEDVDVGEFPVFEGDSHDCDLCGIELCVWVDQAGDTPHGGHAYLEKVACGDCGRPKDPECKRCGGTGLEPSRKPEDEDDEKPVDNRQDERDEEDARG